MPTMMQRLSKLQQKLMGAIRYGCQRFCCFFFFISKQSDSAKAKGGAAFVYIAVTSSNANAMCLLYLLGTKPHALSICKSTRSAVEVAMFHLIRFFDHSLDSSQSWNLTRLKPSFPLDLLWRSSFNLKVESGNLTRLLSCFLLDLLEKQF